MPAGGAWGTFNPYTHQQQNSQGRGWGGNVYRGGQRPSQQQSRYQQPPMPYSGAGAWGQPQGRGGYPQPQRPSGRGGGGGIGGFGGGGLGMTRGIGGRGAYVPPSREDTRYQMMMESGMGRGSADYIQSLPDYRRAQLMQRAGWGGGLPEMMLSQQPMWSGLQRGRGQGMYGNTGDYGGWGNPSGGGGGNPWMGGGF